MTVYDALETYANGVVSENRAVIDSLKVDGNVGGVPGGRAWSASRRHGPTSTPDLLLGSAIDFRTLPRSRQSRRAGATISKTPTTSLILDRAIAKRWSARVLQDEFLAASLARARAGLTRARQVRAASVSATVLAFASGLTAIVALMR